MFNSISYVITIFTVGTLFHYPFWVSVQHKLHILMVGRHLYRLKSIHIIMLTYLNQKLRYILQNSISGTDTNSVWVLQH